jgi:hypothetical protein
MEMKGLIQRNCLEALMIMVMKRGVENRTAAGLCSGEVP